MTKRLLTEVQNPYVLKPIKQGIVENAKTGSKDFVVVGIFGKVDAINENKRIYPKTEMEKNLAEGSIFKSRLKARAVLGELEHPAEGTSGLKTASHFITDVWLEDLNEASIKKYGYTTEQVKPGSYIIGKMEVFEKNPEGQRLREYFEKGINVGVSSRGRGETQVESNGIERVYNYDLETFDAVSLPSVVEARPKPVSEGIGLDAPGDIAPADTGAVSSDIPDAGAPEPGASPLDSTPPPGLGGGDTIDSWKEEAADLVRAITQVASEDDPDLKDMIELMSKSMGSVETLASKDDPEAQKFKGEILAVGKVLATRAMSLATGKKINSYEKKEDNGDEEDEDKDKKKKKKESVEEAVAELKDGQIVDMPVSFLEDYAGHNVIGEWMKRQTNKTTPAMIYSRGSAGVLMKLVDPIVQSYDVFVSWDKINGLKNIKKESKMETKVKIENKEEKKPEKPVEEAKTTKLGSIELIQKLTQEVKTLKDENKKLSEQTKVNPEDVVSKERYEGAKKVIVNLSRRIKLSEKKRAVALKLVKESQEKVAEQKEKAPSLRERIQKKIIESKKGSTRRDEADDSSKERIKRLSERAIDLPMIKKQAGVSNAPNVMSAVAKRISQK